MLCSPGFNCCSFHGSLSLCGHLIRILNKYSPFLRNQILAVAPDKWIVPDGLMSWDLPQFKAYLWRAAWMQYEVLHRKRSAPKSQAIIKACCNVDLPFHDMKMSNCSGDVYFSFIMHWASTALHLWLYLCKICWVKETLGRLSYLFGTYTW